MHIFVAYALSITLLGGIKDIFMNLRERLFIPYEFYESVFIQVSGFDENGNSLFMDVSKYSAILLNHVQDILMN